MSSLGGLPHIHRWAGLSAVGAVVLFATANALWAFEQPDPGASGPELLDFYGDLSGRIVAGALALAVLGVLLLRGSAMNGHRDSPRPARRAPEAGVRD